MSSAKPLLLERRPEQKPPSLPNLTALRFFAAVLVLLYHADVLGKITPYRLVAPFFKQGFLGVPLFFLLSGFVLAYSHLEVRNWRSFYIARFARVYTLYLLAFLLMLPFAAERHRITPLVHQRWAVPADLLLLQAWIPGWQWTGNPAAWTLSVEAFFYLLFPLLLPWVVRQLRWRWAWIMVLWLLFLILPMLIEHRQFASRLGISRFVRFYPEDWIFTPPTFLGEFVMGMFAGAYFRRHSRSFSTTTTCAVVMVAVAVLYRAEAFGYFTARNSGMALVLLPLIYVLAGWPSRFLASKPMQLTGETSYGMYLLQFWAFEVVESMPAPFHHLPVTFALLGACSWCTYTLVEKPARSWLLRTAGIKAPPKPIPTPALMP